MGEIRRWVTTRSCQKLIRYWWAAVSRLQTSLLPKLSSHALDAALSRRGIKLTAASAPSILMTMKGTCWSASSRATICERRNILSGTSCHCHSYTSSKERLTSTSWFRQSWTRSRLCQPWTLSLPTYRWLLSSAFQCCAKVSKIINATNQTKSQIINPSRSLKMEKC